MADPQVIHRRFPIETVVCHETWFLAMLPLLVLVLACCTGVLGMGRGESPPRQDGVTIVGQEQAKPKPESPLTLSIHTGKKEYRQLQPIAIEFDLHNTTADQHFLYFDSYPAPNDFTLIVWRKGLEVPRTTYDSDDDRKDTNRKGSMRILRPGRTIKGRIVVNLLHDMTAPGEYTIALDAVMRSKGLVPTPDDVHVRSEQIKVTILRGPQVDSEE